MTYMESDEFSELLPFDKADEDIYYILSFS